MNIQNFIRKPQRVQAIQWTGTNFQEFVNLVGDTGKIDKTVNGALVIANNIVNKNDMLVKDGDGAFMSWAPEVFDSLFVLDNSDTNTV